MPRRHPSTSLLTAAAVLAGALVAVVPVTPAYAAESFLRPADGVFHLAGHGWGHGRGMSQYGAQGAASQGQSATSILNFYYPNTGQAVLPDSWMRVWLQAASPTSLTIDPEPGLAFRDVSNGNLFSLPAGPSRWRLTIDAAAMHVQGLTAAGWTTYSFGGQQNFVGPLRLGAGATPLHLYFPDGTARDYDGTLTGLRTSATTIKTTNMLTLEQYLYGVVPRESPSSWPAAALQAQAVAARSYSAYKRAHVPAGSTYDICDTTSCQVYGGRTLYSGDTVIPLQPASTTAAVDGTSGVVRTYNAAPIFAEFSSSNGGYSVASPNVPYLTAHPDPYDGVNNANHNWTATLTATQLEARYPTVGHLDSLQVLGRDGNGEWGGRVLTVRLLGHSSTGAATSVDTTGAGVYAANPWPNSATGLRSSWWTVTNPAAPAFTGSLVAASSGAVVPSAGTTTVSFDVRNTGNLSWPVRGAVRSATVASSSPSRAADWIAPTRPGSLTGNVSAPGSTIVAPGQVGRFSFTLAGNGRPAGTVTEHFTVVWEMAYGMSIDVPLTYSVSRSLTGTLAGGSSSVVVPRNGTAPVYFDVRNTGNVAWPLGGAVRSTTAAGSPSTHSSWIAPTRPGHLDANLSTPGATSVAPGQTGRFTFSLAGNGRPAGTAGRETFGVVWEMVGGIAVTATISYVVRDDFTGTLVGQSAEATVPSTGAAPVYFDVRNTGNLAWPVGGAVRSTVAAGSPSANPSWIAPTRPGHLDANLSTPGATSVAPGQTGRFTFSLAGNGRPVGASGRESFGVVWEMFAGMPLSVPLAYRIG